MSFIMAMDWDKLRTFYVVVQAGSFTHAGEKLKLSQSAISRQILGLESSLKVSLFFRHARGLVLTEQGEILYAAVQEIFSKLAMVESLMTENKDQPQGMLKITTTVAFGELWLAPRMHTFTQQYPQIRIELILDDKELDLSRRDADIGIRIIPSKNPDLIQRKLLSYGLYVYASKKYLEEFGEPKKPEDLKNHRLIAFGEAGGSVPVEQVNWLLSCGLSKGFLYDPYLCINNMHGIFQVIQSGIGIGVLPEYVVSCLAHGSAKHDLVRILSNVPSPKVQSYFVYPSELRHSKRISVFRDFLLDTFAQEGLETA